MLCVAMTTHVSHGKPPGRRHNVISSDVKALLRPKPTLEEGRSPLLYNEHCQTLAAPLVDLTEHTSQRVWLVTSARSTPLMQSCRTSFLKTLWVSECHANSSEAQIAQLQTYVTQLGMHIMQHGPNTHSEAST